MNARVVSELRTVQPLDDLERAHLEDALEWACSGAQLHRLEKPAIPPKHLVSYFALLDGGHILLVDHRNARLWLPTGGHVEPDEDPRATVVRELKEELGLAVPLEAVGPPLMVTVTTTTGLTQGHTDVSLWYTVTAARSQAFDFSREEFHGIRWFDISEVPLERSDPHMGRFIEKLRATRGPALPQAVATTGMAGIVSATGQVTAPD